MKPISLTLQGFTGINSGFGRDQVTIDLSSVPEDAKLVALVGPNGAGKSTIMDNLHPFRVMPSRSSTLGPSGFSYWDNICKPTALKDLIWEHAGHRYRSTLSFKVAGKTKKADCYLFQWNGALGDWVPVKLDDGTLSDGKTDTYDRCVEGILCHPDLFFTSQFSAQKRKSLSDYGVSQIKSLLASILNLNHLRELSAKAALVGKLLRFQLEGLQDEISQSRGADAGIAEVMVNIDELDRSSDANLKAEQAAVEVLDQARKSLTLLEAKRDSLAKDDEERLFLNDQIKRLKENADSQVTKIQAQAKLDLDRLANETANAKTKVQDAESGIRKVDLEVARLDAVMAQKNAIETAVAALPNHQAELAAIDEQLQVENAKLAEAAVVRNQLQEVVRLQAELKTSGISKTEAIAMLKQTASLIDQVPCKGSAMQHKCPLLAQANEAKSGLPGHQAVLVDMRARYADTNKRRDQLDAKLAEFSAIEESIKQINAKRSSVLQSIDAANRLSAMAVLLKDAEDRLPQLAESKKQLQGTLEASSNAILASTKETEAIAEGRKKAIDEVSTRTGAEVGELTARINKLAAPVSESEIAQAKLNVQSAMNGVEAQRAKSHAVTNQRVALLAKIEAFKSIKLKSEASVAESERLAEEIAKWKLIEKGMGNDGLVALSIDDAGPEISSICNALLYDCYEGRFAVRMDTQSETQAGNIRETFEVMVLDNHRGEEKSLSTMSGGEQVWVNDCLTRAIALYVGQSSTVQLLTLFSDESDGPLDPDRKRQFMQMKRSVLDRGGYEREYFISQTPELWEAADHVINVTAL